MFFWAIGHCHFYGQFYGQIYGQINKIGNFFPFLISLCNLHNTNLSGKLVVEASLDREVFYHGEDLAIHISIVNNSKKCVKNIRVSFS